MAVSLSRRRFFRQLVEMGKSWDLVLLIALPIIFALTVVFTIKAVLLTPVAIENKERLEQQFQQNRQEAIHEYEFDLSRQSK